MHLAVIRLFVESILRYGLPPQFQAAVIKPLPKMDARLRAVLLATFGTGGSRTHRVGLGAEAEGKGMRTPFISL